MDEETLTYLVFSAIVPLLTLANLGSFGGGANTFIVILMTGLMVSFLLIMAFADFLLFPLITGIIGINFQPYRNYKITKGQDAVIKNVGGLYYATGYVTANLFAFVFKAERLTEDDESKQVQAPENWERAIMSIPFAFKFHVVSSALDVQVIRDELEGKRSYQEFQMSRAMQSGSSNEVIITDMQRKINVIQTQMDRISQGEKPVGTLMYLETTAVGVSEKAALDSLSAQIKQLQLALGSLDVQLQRIVGRELYTLFKFNFALPTTYPDISTNFDIQK